MAKVRKIEPSTPEIRQRKRVAAYARVSKQSDRMMNSLSAQVSYYNSCIQKNPDLEYAGVYSDGFISGTNKAGRDEFRRLIEDCEAGKIDIILTKSISRFARNTVDLLETVRYLKSLGIEVRFERENISTLSTDGELMLTILASFAQEESNSISENCKWGIRRKFQSGEIGAANKHVLGYRYDDEQGKYIIIPDEAKIVRRMFGLFLEGLSFQAIADKLNAAGNKTVLGNDFCEGSVYNLIHNEIYAGDLRRQKSFIQNPISKTKVINRGQFPQYYMEDCHEAIIDRSTYENVLDEISRRAEMKNPVYCFTGKIRCGICGNLYSRKKSVLKGKTYVSWLCRSKKEAGRTCTSDNFSESDLMKISADILEIPDFDENIFENEVSEIAILLNGDIEFHLNSGEIKAWRNLKLLKPNHTMTLTDCFHGKIHCGICGNVYHRVNSANTHVYWYCIGKRKKSTKPKCGNINYPDFHLRQISAYVMGLDEFSESEFEKQIQKIVVLEDGSLEFHFTDGGTKLWQRV